MAGLDIILYIFINALLIGFAVLAWKLWNILGAVGGLVGAILTFSVFQSETLIFNTTYDQTAQVFVSQSVAMGWFAYVPLVLTILNFIVAFKQS